MNEIEKPEQYLENYLISLFYSLSKDKLKQKQRMTLHDLYSASGLYKKFFESLLLDNIPLNLRLSNLLRQHNRNTMDLQSVSYKFLPDFIDVNDIPEEHLNDTIITIIDNWNKGFESKSKLAESCGICRQTMYKYLRQIKKYCT